MPECAESARFFDKVSLELAGENAR